MTRQVSYSMQKKAVEDFKDLEIILFGDKEQYNLNHDRIDFRHCSEKLKWKMSQFVQLNVRKIVRWLKWQKVKSGEADGCVSAGNTGALMSAGLFIVGRIKGVARPALVVTLPTTDGKGFVFLDVGANADAKAEHLLQYAQLGNIYAQKIRGINNPSVSLLNIGTEAAKGNSLTKKAYELFEKIILSTSKAI